MLTDLQRYNLSILADYLIELPVDYRHFEMALYNAVGHVPYTGIAGWEAQGSWDAVAANLLGAEPAACDGIFYFLFDQDNPDCPWAAALRIRHFLAHNSTEGFEYPHGLTLEQYQNLRRLAAYLIALPEDYEEFDMAHWSGDDESPQETKCGTVACAGGHGPMAGIPAQPDDDWSSYIHRSFTGGDTSGRLIVYIFGGEWTRHDNTPQGAGKRILHALHHGIPEEDRCYDPTVYGG